MTEQSKGTESSTAPESVDQRTGAEKGSEASTTEGEYTLAVLADAQRIGRRGRARSKKGGDDQQSKGAAEVPKSTPETAAHVTLLCAFSCACFLRPVFSRLCASVRVCVPSSPPVRLPFFFRCGERGGAGGGAGVRATSLSSRSRQRWSDGEFGGRSGGGAVLRKWVRGKGRDEKKKHTDADYIMGVGNM